MGRWVWFRMSLHSPSALETGRNPGVLWTWGKVPSRTFYGAHTFPRLLGCLATPAPYPQFVRWLAFKFCPLDMSSFGRPACKTLFPQNSQGTRCSPYTIWRVRKHHFIPQPQTVYFSLKCKDVHFLILSSKPNTWSVMTGKYNIAFEKNHNY